MQAHMQIALVVFLPHSECAGLGQCVVELVIPLSKSSSSQRRTVRGLGSLSISGVETSSWGCCNHDHSANSPVMISRYTTCYELSHTKKGSDVCDVCDCWVGAELNEHRDVAISLRHSKSSLLFIDNHSQGFSELSWDGSAVKTGCGWVRHRVQLSMEDLMADVVE